MITLITGVPGMGKTAYTVLKMLREQEKGERPFFVMGIPDLKLDYSPCPPVSEWTVKKPSREDPDILEDHFTFPPNSIIVIDEAQKVYRPRASGSKVPPYVAAFETHRHLGLDFWLMTQKPGLIDSNVRDLVGRHIHIKEGAFFGRFIYEWSEYQDVKNRSVYQDAARRPFKPPKEVFGLYKSAELHTKQPKRKIHQAFYVLAASLLVTLYLGFNLYQSWGDRMQSAEAESELLEAQDLAPNDNELVPVTLPTVEALRSPDVIVPPPPVAEHPFMGYEFFITGYIKSASREAVYFHLSKGDDYIDITGDELTELGYSITMKGYCSAFLYFKGAGVVASCRPDTGAPRRGGAGAASLNPLV